MSTTTGTWRLRSVMRRLPPGKSRTNDSPTERHTACSSSAIIRLSSPISMAPPGIPANQSCGVSVVLSLPVSPMEESAAPTAPRMASSSSRGPQERMFMWV